MSSMAGVVAATQREMNFLSLPDSCAIQSLVGDASDGAGGTTGGTWTTQATVACQVTTAGKLGTAGAEAVIADRMVEVVDASVLVPAATPVDAKQRIVHTDSLTGVVTTYAAVSVSKPTGFEILRTVNVQVVSP